MEPCGKDNKRAAFPGAAFTLHGACINHRDIQVCTPILVDGRMKYKQMMICPKCSRGVDRNCSNMCLSSNDEERIVYTKQRKSHRKQAHPIVSNKEGSSNSSLNTTFDTPFDSKGRCHHHRDVKLALKQCGEWKVLVDTCPMCREEAIARSKSSKPERSREQKYIRKYDEDGHCINHPDIRIAKKNMRGSWKVKNECPKCASKDDSVSVYSSQTKDSRGTYCSAKSNKSSRSRSSRKSRDDDVSLVMQDGKATQGQSHWSNVSSSKQTKNKPKGIKRFLLASIAM